MEPWVRYPYPASKLTSYLLTDDARAPRVALLLGDKLAGVAGLCFNWLLGPYLQLLAVFPGYQREGIGQAFLKWFEKNARGAGARSLWVCTSDFNADALRFYESFGFRRVADLHDLVQDGYTEVLMRKRVCE
jgi:GNAT superfamily N-acetyltransferase